MDNLTLLKNTGVFEGLSESELKSVLDGCKEQAYPIGTIIIQENDPPKKVLFMVKSGAIVISTSAPSSEERSGSEDSMITTLGECDVFGEVSLIDNDPHSATVRAISDATLLLLPASHFFSIVDSDKNIGYVVIRNIARTIAQRLRDTNMYIHFGLYAGQGEKP